MIRRVELERIHWIPVDSFRQNRFGCFVNAFITFECSALEKRLENLQWLEAMFVVSLAGLGNQARRVYLVNH